MVNRSRCLKTNVRDELNLGESVHSRKAKIFIIIASLACLWLIGSVWYFNKALPVFIGFAAKSLCSGVFISARIPGVVFEDDIRPMIKHAPWVNYAVSMAEKSVTVDLAGVFKRQANYRPGCGCTLAVDGGQIPKCNNIESQMTAKRPTEFNGQWPLTSDDPPPPFLNATRSQRLSDILQNEFKQDTSNRKAGTRALVIVYGGNLIAERYAEGFNENMPLAGWSMSKSVINALVGILVKKKLLLLDHPAPVAEWERPDDSRNVITLNDLLRMSSGLKFSEVYVPPSDVTSMLFESADFAAFAARMPLAAPPGTEWQYSSGTTNIIAGIIRQAVEKEYGSLTHFANRELFDRLNMQSMVMELDPSGTVVGSSYMFASAKDWARLGLLYLQNGMWLEQEVLPPAWVKYTRTPAPAAPSGNYGAHFWLNAGPADDPSVRPWPRLPPDMYYAQGFKGQYLIIIPSRHLVLVRLGLDRKPAAWDMQGFVAALLEEIFP